MSDFHIKPEYIKNISRQLRKWQTESEKLLWKILRKQKINSLKFLRQKPIFAYKQDNQIDRFYIADFYCHSLKLIIEIDWLIHNKKERIEYDDMRDRILKNNNYTVLRFTNNEIKTDINSVINKIILFSQMTV